MPGPSLLFITFLHSFGAWASYPQPQLLRTDSCTTLYLLPAMCLSGPAYNRCGVAQAQHGLGCAAGPGSSSRTSSYDRQCPVLLEAVAPGAY
jgi:hypothetical protein